jgi:sulfite reductase (NADPH) flavoprotein alpha-component
VAYLLLRSSPKRGASSHEATDFDSFLRAPAHTAAAPSTNNGGRPGVEATSFDAFLKVKPVEPDPAVFSTWLKSGGGAVAAPTTAVVDEAAEEEEAPLDAVRVLVMYGTEYGFSKEIAEKVCARLKEGGAYW